MKHLRFRLTLVVGLSLLLGLLVGRPAHAATTFTVTNCSNDSQLQADVSTANSDNADDTITFACSGDIPVTSTLTIAGSMTLDGGGQTVTLDGQHQRQVLFVSSFVTLTLNALTIANGSSGDFGGGISNFGSLLSIMIITNSTFSGNSASFGGGGIENEGGTLSITNSTFSGNSASFGGGIDNDFGTLSITNSTFSGNSASFGGGILNNIGTLSITNSTISGNSAQASSDGGGGIFNNGLPLNILGSIVADNTGTGGDCSIVVFDTIDQGYNLESGTSCGFTGTGSLQNTEPKLDPNGLQNNGGPTQTLALEPDSPAVDQIPASACTVATDQRGVTRPQGPACDMGAFEMATADGLTVMIHVVNSFHLAKGLQTSLDIQLQNVLAGLHASNTAKACGDLTSFINHVEAQSGKGLTTAQATQLLDEAAVINTRLGC